MRRPGHVLNALAEPGFRRLFAVRLCGQFGDGVFQTSLAGAVLFNPERQAHAADVAAGFAVVLLPYSLIGPFAGVLLDRWWRQRVLVLANVVRAMCVGVVALEILGGVTGAPFYVSALVVISISRFFLSALSAALPHLIAPAELVTANALSTTVGSVATTLGGATAVAIRAVGGSSNGSYAAVAAAAALPFLLSAFGARRFGRQALGPDDVERGSRETVAAVARGLVAGARHVHERRPAFYGLCAIGVHRLCYGVTTVCTLLLFRNYFADQGVFRSGLPGLAQVIAAAALGGALAAVATPAATRRLGYARWPAALLLAAAVVQLTLVLPYRLALVPLAAVLLGIVSQGIKITVDTLIQRTIEDDFRGRVFALYDTLFNVALVTAAVLTAVVLPEDGYAPASVLVIAAAYLVTGGAYLRAASRLPAQDLAVTT